MTTSTYKNEHLKFSNGYFYFTSIAEPKFKYQSTTEKEYGLTFFMSKEDAKAFKKLGVNKTVKETDNVDFEKSYKTPPPFPNQDEQYSITVTQNVTTKTGKNLPEGLRPKTYILDELGTAVESTDTLIGNGSAGILKVLKQTNLAIPENKPTIKLSEILVTKLIPYEKKVKTPWEAVDLGLPISDEVPF